MNINTPAAGLVQIVDPMCAMGGDHLAEFADIRRPPTRPVRHNDMRNIENLVPTPPAAIRGF